MGTTVGVGVAVLSAMLNFHLAAVLPVLERADHRLDIFVVWALIAHGRDIAA